MHEEHIYTMARPKKIESATANTTTTTTSATSSSSSSTSASSSETPRAVVMKLNPQDSDRLQLAQAINNLVVKGEGIVAALNELSLYDKEKIQSIDMKLESKKKEYADATLSLTEQYESLSKKLENEYADLKIKLSQQLREFKQEAAVGVLKEFNMIAIEANKYETIVEQHALLQQTSQDALQKAVKETESREKHEHQQTLHAIQLEHKATIANLEAQVSQQVKEIKVLHETISGLKHELSEQRQLTKDVAQASSKAQISQSFAK